MEGGDRSEMELLQERLGASWPALAEARRRTAALRQRIETELAEFTDSEDTSVVVFGSLARGEVTSASDVDWTLLVDGAADPQHLDMAFEIGKRVAGLANQPGREGTFGGIAVSHDLIHKIGGSDDTNRNTTQRILLLLESAVIGRSDAYDRVVRNVLRRYILEDFGWMRANNPFNVPRFLQNDIARYWRTVAVDFAYKRRERQEKGWALRTAKLRMSRKLTYAAGLLMCFSVAMDLDSSALPELGAGARDRDPSIMLLVVDHLWEMCKKTPLDLMARLFLRYPDLEPVARDFFGSYDQFLSLLENEDARKHLDILPSADAASDPVYQDVREMGHLFQEALTKLFLEENGTPLFGLTKTYGVF